MISAKVICDSVNPSGDRLTTMEVVTHRLILAEFNTHRAFSRNSASSRAIPVKKNIEQVLNNPACPISWGLNKAGMQAGDELSDENTKKAIKIFKKARDKAVEAATELHEMGVHKQVVNRLLEPFLWHTIVVSSTEWENFLSQRCSPLAQPEMRRAAEEMRLALRSSTPVPKKFGEWHLPYISGSELAAWGENQSRKISVARCAWVSYLNEETRNNAEKDLERYEKLHKADPPHASPFEHVAVAYRPIAYEKLPGNFSGWKQFRHIMFPPKKEMK